MNKLTVRRYAYASTIGVFAFIVAFLLGTPLDIALSPLMGGILNAIITAMIVGIGCKGVEKFGYSMIIWGIFSIPAIFTFTMGMPGAHKILIGVFTGFVMDVLFKIFKRSHIAYFIIGGIMSDVMTVLTLFAMLILNISPESVEKLSNYIVYLLPLYFVMGGLGMFLGSKIFDKRLKHLNIIKSLNE